MIDIHNHSLFCVDDGAQSLEESLELLKQEAEQGMKDVIVTPHYILDATYHMDGLSVLRKMNELQQLCLENEIHVMLHPGHELFIHQLLPHCLKEKKCLSLANSRYVLIEFPFDEYLDEYDFILEDLRAMGYLIVIAHPERYQYVQKDVNFCLRWLDQGDLLQCNQNSFLRKETKKLVTKMIDHDFVSFIASDAHGFKRPVRLKDAYEEVVHLAGKQKAEELFVLNAKKILQDELIENDDYVPVKKFLGLF